MTWSDRLSVTHTRWLTGVLRLRQIAVCSSDPENKLAGRVGHPSLCDAGAYSCEVSAMSIKNIETIKTIYVSRRTLGSITVPKVTKLVLLSARSINGHES
jgi:hypothetical protein